MSAHSLYAGCSPPTYERKTNVVCSVPAILKGWFDRVFAMGRFYGSSRVRACVSCSVPVRPQMTAAFADVRLGSAQGQEGRVVAHHRRTGPGLRQGRLHGRHSCHPPPGPAWSLALCWLLVRCSAASFLRALSLTLSLSLSRCSVLAPNIVNAPVRISQEEREAALAAWKQRLQTIEAEEPIDVGEY